MQITENYDPEVLQSGFGVTFFGVWRILGKVPANLSANFDSEFFGPVFQGLRPPPLPGAPKKNHAQNSRPNLSLVAPYRAILRYYRCDTPYRSILFKGGQHSPKMVRKPPLLLSFTQAHLCDTPFCNVSRDNCATSHKNKHERVLRYYRCKYRAI